MCFLLSIAKVGRMCPQGVGLHAPVSPKAKLAIGSSNGGYILTKKHQNFVSSGSECEHNFVDICDMTLGCWCCDNVNP